MIAAISRRSAEDIRKLRAGQSDVRVLDVRTRDAREMYPHQLAGADWVPLAGVVDYARSVPRGTALVLYCT